MLIKTASNTFKAISTLTTMPAISQHARIIRVPSFFSPSLECNKRKNRGKLRLRIAINLPDESALSNSAWLLTACAQTIFVRLRLTLGKNLIGSGETLLLLLHRAASETREATKLYFIRSCFAFASVTDSRTWPSLHQYSRDRANHDPIFAS